MSISHFDPTRTLALAQGQRPMLWYVRRIYRSREAVLTDNRVERRLAAILAADLVGYSRLTGLDEEGTHVRLRERLRGLADPKVVEHRGKVVKYTGLPSSPASSMQRAAPSKSSAIWLSKMLRCRRSG